MGQGYSIYSTARPGTPRPRPEGCNHLTQTSVGFGRLPFFALQDSLLQRTSSMLQLFCNEPLLLAYLSVM